jgi:hypothetical protein
LSTRHTNNIMNHIRIVRLLSVLLLASSGREALAAPSLPVTKPPVQPAASYTGPDQDLQAVMGQWFQNLGTQELEYRAREFYDNPTNSGGGSMGSLAIEGHVTNLVPHVNVFQIVDGITSFDVAATIHNDSTLSPSGEWASGTNTLGEFLVTTNLSTTLSDVIMTVDFASAGTIPNNIENFPYGNSSPYITATNHDFTAWYGSLVYFTQDGGFYAPGWSFGPIPPNQSVTRVFHFVIRDFNGGNTFMRSDDPRYATLMDSNNNGTDILINRSSSLKISQWLSNPAADDGSAYPVNERGDMSNVSVFHNVSTYLSQSIAITSFSRQSSPPMILLNSTGSSGVTWQILQCCTNLVRTNWFDITTQEVWPSPWTNRWTNTTVSGSINFFRIIQP